MARALVVGNIRFKDRQRYDAYAAAFPAVFAQSGGAMLAADENPQMLSGSADGGVDKIVVMQFDSEDSARAFLNSSDYLHIAEDRDAGADVTSWIVKAF